MRPRGRAPSTCSSWPRWLSHRRGCGRRSPLGRRCRSTTRQAPVGEGAQRNRPGAHPQRICPRRRIGLAFFGDLRRPTHESQCATGREGSPVCRTGAHVPGTHCPTGRCRSQGLRSRLGTGRTAPPRGRPHSRQGRCLRSTSEQRSARAIALGGATRVTTGDDHSPHKLVEAWSAQ
jgi:hypothetical protein